MENDFDISLAKEYLKIGNFIRDTLYDTVFFYEEGVVLCKIFNSNEFSELGTLEEFIEKYKDAKFELVIYDEDYAFKFKSIY